LVGDVFKAELGAVEGGGLLGVSNPEADVVKRIKDANSGSLGGFLVVYHFEEVKCCSKILIID
jgi:hypothetical protein